MEWEGRLKRNKLGEMGKCMQIKRQRRIMSKAYRNHKQGLIMQGEMDND